MPLCVGVADIIVICLRAHLFVFCLWCASAGQSRLMLALDPALYSVGYSESSPPGHAPAKQCIHIPILLPVRHGPLVITCMYMFDWNVLFLRVHLLLPIDWQGPKHVTEIELLSIDPQGRAGQVLVLLGNSTRWCSPCNS